MRLGKKEAKPEERTGEEGSRLTQAMLRALRTIHSFSSPDPSDLLSGLQRQRAGQELLGRLITPEVGFRWERFSNGRLEMAWARPERPHPDRPVILYCHGGGYTSGNLGYARILASKMAEATSCEVLAFEYRLAPENPYPAAIEDAVSAWDYLMYRGYGAREVILAGDSAGGNLALALAGRLKKKGRLLPRSLVLFSPWTDMTASGGSVQEMREKDPIITPEYLVAVREAYAPGANYAAGELSPIFADLSGFPPTLLQVGEYELLRDDAIRLKEIMDRAEVPCVLRCWPRMWHVFQMFPLKESQQAMEQLRTFVWT